MDLTNVTWRKASRSGSNGGACVELAGLANVIAVRDSKRPGEPNLVFSRSTFRSFTDTIKNH